MCPTDNVINDSQTSGKRLIAAVKINGCTDVDQIISEIVDELKRREFKIAGYLQRGKVNSPDSRADYYLESVAKGDKVTISQSLGSGSTGCRLDSAALAEFSNKLSSEIEDHTDMIVLNRFGKGESEGQGFRIAIEKAVAMDIPVLTAVRGEYIESWREFCGEFGVEVSPTKEAIFEWCDNVLGSKVNLI